MQAQELGVLTAAVVVGSVFGLLATEIGSHFGDAIAALAFGALSLLVGFLGYQLREPKFLMCDERDLNKNLRGKVIVVTGANSGIGLESCKHFYKQGAMVIMTGRSRSRLISARNEVLASQASIGKRPMPQILITDFADLDQLKKSVEEFHDRFTHIDVLVLNAGIMAVPERQETKQGFEMQMGTNYIGPWVFTELLRSRIKYGGRIVIAASNYSDQGRKVKAQIFFDDLHFKKNQYDAFVAYGQSKLANVLHAMELANLVKQDNITVVSHHPGYVATNLLNHKLPKSVPKFIVNLYLKYSLGQIDVWTGCQTTIHCAVSDQVKKHSGRFFAQSNSPNETVSSKEMLKGGWPLVPHPANARGACTEEAARDLWEVTRAQCVRWLK
eukprot:gene637-232_t